MNEFTQISTALGISSNVSVLILIVLEEERPASIKQGETK